jgi:hypothetical protein
MSFRELVSLAEAGRRLEVDRRTIRRRVEIHGLAVYRAQRRNGTYSQRFVQWPLECARCGRPLASRCSGNAR